MTQTKFKRDFGLKKEKVLIVFFKLAENLPYEAFSYYDTFFII